MKPEYSIIALALAGTFSVSYSALAAPKKAAPKKPTKVQRKAIPKTPVATRVGFDVVRGGRTNAVIVVPDKANEVENYAARELQTHIQKASGATLPIQSESAVKGNAPRLYVGGVRALKQIGYAAALEEFGAATRVPDENIRAVAPDNITTNPGLKDAKILSNAESDSADFILDLGAPRTVAALQVKNYSSTASNYNVGRIAVEKSDDGVNFSPVKEGELEPRSNEAGARRRLDLRTNGKPVSARYFRIRVLGNLWGSVADKANSNAQTIWFESWNWLAPSVSTQKNKTITLNSLPRNTSILQRNGNALFFAGRDDNGSPLADTTSAGTLFAVYEWLENNVGARWLWPGENGTFVRKMANVASGNGSGKFAPAFLHTRWRATVGNPYFVRSENGLSETQRATAAQNERVWYRRQRFHRSLSLDIRHSYTDYWKKFGASHPEYFNLLPDGTRRPDPNFYEGREDLVSMEVSNPALWQQKVREWLSTRSEFEPYLDASENDTQGKSVSPQALAMDVPDPEIGKLGISWNDRVARATQAYNEKDSRWARFLGSMSDRYARYYMAVLNEAKKADPKARVMGFAYENYTDPPRATKLNEDVIVALVPEYFYPRTEAEARKFEKQWNGWRNTGATLMLRPNATLGSYIMPYLTLGQIVHDFQFAAQRGLIGTDYDSLTSMFSTQGLNIYALARLSENPKLSGADILREYSESFGKAAPQIRNYCNFWESLTTQRTARQQQLLKEAKLAPYFSEQMVAGKMISEADFARGKSYLDAAKKAATGDADALSKIDFLAMGLEQARLAAALNRIMSDEKNATNLPAAQIRTAQAFAALDKQRAALAAKYPNALNLDFAATNELRTWNRASYRALINADMLQSLPVEWRLRWDDKNQGEAAQWFSQPGDDALWQPIKTDEAWETQPAGLAKKEAIGKAYDGRAWYRVKFSLNEKARAARGRKLQLLFGAVDESAWIYLNGRKIGERIFKNPNDWQEPFRIDIPADVLRDTDNELMVLVEDKVGAGGVWKPVHIVQTER